MRDLKKIAKITMYVSIFGIACGTAYKGVDFAADTIKEAQSSAASTDNEASSDKETGSSKDDGDSVKTAEQSAETTEQTDDGVKVDTVAAVAGNSGSNHASDVSGVADAVLPSIVAINVTEKVQQNIYGRTYEQESSGSGSGIIIADKDNEILIATNNHVVAGADTVSVEFADGEAVQASVKGTDSDNDLAVVAVNKDDIKSSTLEAIRIARIGNSDNASVGQMVVAIGNAMGYGQSVTVGYISAKDREIDVEDGSMKLIQTDAAINPGNSGGALVNLSGEVIGINSAKFASEEVEGMGFAIPVSTASSIIEALANKETVPEEEQAYLGISGEDISAEDAKMYNIPAGIYVKEVTAGSPAQTAGLQAGMIITSINGTDISSMSELQDQLTNLRAGDEAELSVVKGEMGRYSESKLTVTLGSKKDSEKK